MHKLVQLMLNQRSGRVLGNICYGFSHVEIPSFVCVTRFITSNTSGNEASGKDPLRQDSVAGSEAELDSAEEIPSQYKILFEKPRMKVPRSSLHSHEVKRDFAPPPNDDPDTFGILTGHDKSTLEFYDGDEGDKREDEFTTFRPATRLPQSKYVDMVKEFLRQRRFADALDVLEKRMKEDRVSPAYYIYGILISYCGKAGYTKKAFQLYNDMKKRRLYVSPAVYTSLFNSCANTHNLRDGLQCATHLLELMKEKGVQPGQITYHAMIKAFGRCGDITKAFSIADEMMSKKLSLNPDTFCFLLQACISQKEIGFRYALLVFRKMLQFKILPTVFHYHLLLRCARDCDIGDIRSVADVLSQIGVKNVQISRRQKEPERTSESAFPWDIRVEDSVSEQNEEIHISLSEAVQEAAPSQCVSSKSSDVVLSENLPELNTFPNLLAKNPTLGHIISLSEVYRPEDRLLLLGGADGFLKEMAKYDVKPNVETFTLLLDCIPSTSAAESALIKAMESSGNDPDTAFCNALIRRRCFRKDYDGAKEVATLMSKNGLLFDLLTFGGLAMTCGNRAEAQQLLQAMTDCGLRPNDVIIGALLRRAMRKFDFKYIDMLCGIILEEKMQISSRILVSLDLFKSSCIANLKYEKSNPRFPDSVYRAMKKFCFSFKDLKTKLGKLQGPKNHQLWTEACSETATETDEVFFSQYVEKDEIKSNFPKALKETRVKVEREKQPAKLGEDMGGIPIGMVKKAKMPQRK